jgi:hypothetical protein
MEILGRFRRNILLKFLRIFLLSDHWRTKVGVGSESMDTCVSGRIAVKIIIYSEMKPLKVSVKAFQDLAFDPQ